RMAPLEPSARSGFALDKTIPRPLEQSLPLARAACQCARRAVVADLAGVAGEVAPAADLGGVDVRDAAAHPVAAVPLEPAAGVGTQDPALFAPDAQGLAGFNAEVVQGLVWLVR